MGRSGGETGFVLTPTVSSPTGRKASSASGMDARSHSQALGCVGSVMCSTGGIMTLVSSVKMSPQTPSKKKSTSSLMPRQKSLNKLKKGSDKSNSLRQKRPKDLILNPPQRKSQRGMSKKRKVVLTGTGCLMNSVLRRKERLRRKE